MTSPVPIEIGMAYHSVARSSLEHAAKSGRPLDIRRQDGRGVSRIDKISHLQASPLPHEQLAFWCTGPTGVSYRGAMAGDGSIRFSPDPDEG